jgi:hypothetical protein
MVIKLVGYDITPSNDLKYFFINGEDPSMIISKILSHFPTYAEASDAHEKLLDDGLLDDHLKFYLFLSTIDC